MTKNFRNPVDEQLTALQELADQYPLYIPISALIISTSRRLAFAPRSSRGPAPSASAGNWVTVRHTRYPRSRSSHGSPRAYTPSARNGHQAPGGLTLPGHWRRYTYDKGKATL